MIFVAIATVVFLSSCESKSGKRKSSFRNFKEMVEKSRLDSSLVEKKENVNCYTFYLPEYKIEIQATDAIPFKSAGKIVISTSDVSGEFINEFCSSSEGCPSEKWTNDQHQEILGLLLAKKDKQSLPKKDEPKFVLY